MLMRAKKITKRYGKAALLIVVYFLHIALLQALMAAPVMHKSDGDFKPLFAHSHTTPPTHAPNHPAVSYYTMLVKQGNSGLRSCCEVLVSYISVGAFFDVNTSLLTERHYQLMPCVLRDIGDDSYKLYRFLGTFLI